MRKDEAASLVGRHARPSKGGNDDSEGKQRRAGWSGMGLEIDGSQSDR